MNKAILCSIQPQWTKKIIDGTKQYEFRGKNTRNWKSGMKVYIYETQATYKGLGINLINGVKPFVTTSRGKGKVIGEFVIGDIVEFGSSEFVEAFNDTMVECFEKGLEDTYYISEKNLQQQGFTNQQYAYEITQLKVYPKPKELSEFMLFSKWEKYNYLDKTLDDVAIDLKDMHKVIVDKPPQSFMYIMEHTNED